MIKLRRLYSSDFWSRSLYEPSALLSFPLKAAALAKILWLSMMPDVSSNIEPTIESATSLIGILIPEIGANHQTQRQYIGIWGR